MQNFAAECKIVIFQKSMRIQMTWSNFILIRLIFDNRPRLYGQSVSETFKICNICRTNVTSYIVVKKFRQNYYIIYFVYVTFDIESVKLQ